MAEKDNGFCSKMAGEDMTTKVRTQPEHDASEGEAVTGWLKTEWDCPHCGYDNVSDGDASQSEQRCAGCGRNVEIEKVM